MTATSLHSGLFDPALPIFLSLEGGGPEHQAFRGFGADARPVASARNNALEEKPVTAGAGRVKVFPRCSWEEHSILARGIPE